MAFTSRGPRNRTEIAACIALLRQSPYWRGSELTQDEATECWVHLLKSGLGLIDINEYTKSDFILVNLPKVQENGFYSKGYVSVSFVCGASLEVVKSLVRGDSGSQDPVVFFTSLYKNYLDGKLAVNPSLDLGPKGEVRSDVNWLIPILQ